MFRESYVSGPGSGPGPGPGGLGAPPDSGSGGLGDSALEARNTRRCLVDANTNVVVANGYAEINAALGQVPEGRTMISESNRTSSRSSPSASCSLAARIARSITPRPKESGVWTPGRCASRYSRVSCSLSCSHIAVLPCSWVANRLTLAQRYPAFVRLGMPVGRVSISPRHNLVQALGDPKALPGEFSLILAAV